MIAAQQAVSRPRRAYSFARSGNLWMPAARPEEKLEALGGGPCGAFSTRIAGNDTLWQPTDVSGFVIDINPRFRLTTGLNGARVTTAQIVNNAPSATDVWANSNLSLQPTYEPNGWGGAFGAPSILFNGVSYYLASTTSLAGSLVGGDDTPFTWFIVGHFLSLPGVGVASCPIYMGSTSDVAPLWDFFVTGGAWKCNKRGNTGSILGVSGGTADTAKHIFEIVHYGTTFDLLIDGVAIITGGAQNLPTLTANAIAIGGSYGASSPGDWANFRWARGLAFTGARSPTERDNIRSHLITGYF